ncbi:MAG: hypothetical protein KF775_04215 [Cyclobacteriaceae bacterium]|nr:hypothetical protein [Cyclobacteriaceae bacterium]
MSTRIFRLGLSVLGCLLLATQVFAQPGDPCPGGPPCDPDVPISGIEILVLVGGALGLGKFFVSKGNRNPKE